MRLKLATVPSTSEPLRVTAITVSSLPVADVASGTGASLTGVTVNVNVLVAVVVPSEIV